MLTFEKKDSFNIDCHKCTVMFQALGISKSSIEKKNKKLEILFNFTLVINDKLFSSKHYPEDIHVKLYVILYWHLCFVFPQPVIEYKNINNV